MEGREWGGEGGEVRKGEVGRGSKREMPRESRRYAM